MAQVEIVDTTIDNVAGLGVCGYKNAKKEGFPEKVGWLKKRFPEGLVMKTLVSDSDGAQGMIEYIPGELCWRPVDAAGYMFIHCVFVGFKSTYKNKGYASLLLAECEKDARKSHLHGVSVVTRKGSFMIGQEFFLKHDYAPVATATPDFVLLAKRFRAAAPAPRFNLDARRLDAYSHGLFIIRADQCPYTVKNVREICETAKADYGIEPRVVHLDSCQAAQASPSPFGTFCVILDGVVVADSPISRGRFINIMNKRAG
jgi:hypothetical protein